MKKTFQDLTPSDRLFVANTNSDTYKSVGISTITETEIKNGEGTDWTIPRQKVTALKKDGYYNQSKVFFANECDAIRYCKAQGIKTIRGLIKEAESAIIKVKQYREARYDDLNTNWLEANINRLEKQLT